MNELYNRKTGVFCGAGSADALNNIILQMRFRWRNSDIVESIPQTLSHGDTALLELYIIHGILHLKLVGRHPLNADIYYMRNVEVPLAATETVRFVPAGAGGMTVVPDEIFMVRMIPVSDRVIYALYSDSISLTIDTTNVGQSSEFSQTLIEPHNIIFDPLRDIRTLKVIDGEHNELEVGDATVFTNNPVESGADVVPGYTLNIYNNTLGFVATPQPTASDVGIIRSINGVRPVNGNINIQVAASE